MWTDRSDGRVTDCGASWIHGIADSPVAAAASAFGMRMVEFTVGGYQPDSRPMAHYSPEGARLSPAAAAAYVADIHAVDAALAEAIAASGPLATYRDVTETALGAQGWPPERLQRVREYLEVVASLMAPLRRLFGEDIADSVAVQHTAWQDDPFARGSYAFMLPGSTTADHDALATPIGEVLHIAGEATWTDDPATVTAALCSGHRAAQNVLGAPVPIERTWDRSHNLQQA